MKLNTVKAIENGIISSNHYHVEKQQMSTRLPTQNFLIPIGDWPIAEI